MLKLTKDDLITNFFKKHETLTIQANDLRNLFIALEAKDREIKLLKKRMAQLIDELETKDSKIARLQFELMQKEPVYTLDLSA